MKVLVLTSGYPTAERPMTGIFIKEQVDSLRANGVEVDTLNIKGSLRRFSYLSILPELRRQLDKRYDLIHAHYGTVGWVGRMQCRAPLVISFLGDDALGTPNQQGQTTWRSQFLVYSHRILARLADAVLVQSAEMKRALRYPRARILTYGVDLNLFRIIDRPEACRQVNLDPAKRYLLFANNPALAVKNFALVRTVFQQVKQQIPQAELVVLSNEARERVPVYMNACDALILTSFHEGSPVVIKEAMACNLPIVSVDVGDVKEAIKGTRNCFIISRDAQEMAGQVVRIFESGQRSDGRAHIGHLEINNIARQIIEVYREVCRKS